MLNFIKNLIVFALILVIILFLSLGLPSLINFFQDVKSNGLIVSLNYYIDKKVLGVTILSLLGLLMTILNYQRKVGSEIQADFGCSMMEGKESLTVLLFNNKDKPVLITEVYIQIYNKICISVGINNETWSNEKDRDKLILKPYEMVSIKTKLSSKFVYGHLELFNIFDAIKASPKKEIIVSTSHGEVPCKKLKGLTPKIVRAFKDNSIVIQNGDFPQNFEPMPMVKFIKLYEEHLGSNKN